MTQFDCREFEHQCAVLREQYRFCMPRSCRAVRYEPTYIAEDESAAIIDISLPYADSELVFSAHFEPESHLPDIAWRQDSLPADFFPDVDYSQFLSASTAATGSGELLAVVDGFVSLLVEFNEALIPQQSFLWRAWHTLTSHELFRNRARYEVLVNRRDCSGGGGDAVVDRNIDGVTIALSLPLKWSTLPAFFTADNVADDFECCLLFRFSRPLANGAVNPSPSSSAVSAAAVEHAVPRLFLSASLKNFLQQTGNELRLPHFNTALSPDHESRENEVVSGEDARPRGDSAACHRRLLDYALYLHDSLQQIINRACESCSARRQVVAALVTRLNGAVLEYDAELYRSASFLLEWKDFYFILRFHLQEYFPHQREGPEIRLRSIYHTVGGPEAGQGAVTGAGGSSSSSEHPREGELTSREPFERVYQPEVPHSPRWEPHEYVERWLKFVHEALPKFQRDSIRNHNI